MSQSCTGMKPEQTNASKMLLRDAGHFVVCATRDDQKNKEIIKQLWREHMLALRHSSNLGLGVSIRSGAEIELLACRLLHFIDEASTCPSGEPGCPEKVGQTIDTNHEIQCDRVAEQRLRDPVSPAPSLIFIMITTD